MNRIIRKWLLTYSNGEDIYLFTLRNAKGSEVSISNYGAIITAFKIKKKDGQLIDILLGLDAIEDYWSPYYLQNHPWIGAAVGRYANRIENACFPLNGKIVQVTDNRNGNQLHGGAEGFDRKVWQLVSFGHHPQLFLELKYLSPDGEEGYPGNLEVFIRFELSDENELSYSYRATTDQSTAINLTHHGYFNLNNGKGTIHNHELKINAKRILQQKEGLVVNGNFEPVENTVFDFQQFKTIGEGLKQTDEYDKSYELTETNFNKPAAELKSAASGLWLQLFTTEPVVHFYSGKWIPAVTGKNNTTYGAFSGLCLETHKHPNAVNIPHFPSTILNPGEVYTQKTVYKVLEL